MNIFKKLIPQFLLLLCFSKGINAQTLLPTFFGDNMVLQQDDSVLLWGMDKPNCPISLSGNCIIGTLYNTAGIPATSFRTDDWDNIGRKNDE